jgi:hypothetical protein
MTAGCGRLLSRLNGALAPPLRRLIDQDTQQRADPTLARDFIGLIDAYGAAAVSDAQ